MSERLRLVMAQLNCIVGDVEGNTSEVARAALKARDALKAHAVVFPELSLSGYPPEDLLLGRGLEARVRRGLQTLQQVQGIDLIVGHPHWQGDVLYNAASCLRDGRVLATYHKQLLPNYSVFDEKRYFIPGQAPCMVDIRGVPVGITICEDAWAPGPANQAAAAGACLLVNLNASPYHLNKGAEREQIVRLRVQETRLPFIYVNLVGGQDELVFDGASFVVDAGGQVTQRAPAFETGLFPVDIELGNPPQPLPGPCAPVLGEEESVYRALVLGVRDYVDKNGFSGAVLGLSGGVDSALTLAIAVDALGAQRVQAVMMPSRYTSAMSLEDAQAQARALGVKYSVIAIEPMFDAFLQALQPEFNGRPPDATEENIQARIRGMLLMAISNKTGRIVLTTGNKSEMAVGYATLYGDMAGGFAVIKDVFKTLVYRLVDYRNRIAPVIPQRVIERAPSAELAPDQRDTDSLPPYPLLDAILEQYIERDRSALEIAAAGFDPQVVERVVAMIRRNEYKRRQAPPGVRITRRAFGRDWRYPITVGPRPKR